MLTPPLRKKRPHITQSHNKPRQRQRHQPTHREGLRKTASARRDAGGRPAQRSRGVSGRSGFEGHSRCRLRSLSATAADKRNQQREPRQTAGAAACSLLPCTSRSYPHPPRFLPSTRKRPPLVNRAAVRGQRGGGFQYRVASKKKRDERRLRRAQGARGGPAAAAGPLPAPPPAMPPGDHQFSFDSLRFLLSDCSSLLAP